MRHRLAKLSLPPAHNLLQTSPQLTSNFQLPNKNLTNHGSDPYLPRNLHHNHLCNPTTALQPPSNNNPKMDFSSPLNLLRTPPLLPHNNTHLHHAPTLLFLPSLYLQPNSSRPSNHLPRLGIHPSFTASLERTAIYRPLLSFR